MKNKTLAIVLALFLGGLGAHKFYLEKPGQGLLYLLFCWTFIPLFLGLIEALNYLSMSRADFDNRYNKTTAPKAVIVTNGIAKCPFCMEAVNPEATLCKHCGSKFISHRVAFMEEGKKSSNAKNNKIALIIFISLFGIGGIIAYLSSLT